MFKYLDKKDILTNKIFKKTNNRDRHIIDYFVKENYLEYLSIFDNINKKQEKALYIIFNGDEELVFRCESALEINNTCFEAFYILNYFSDSLNFYYQTLDIQNIPIENFENEYEKNDVINIKRIILDYYVEINNYHQSLLFLNEIEKYIETEKYITRRLLIHNFLEDYQSMNSLYEKYDFSKPTQYIIYIICLLKNSKKDEAQIIYEDMLSKYRYASYIYKPQELSSINNNESNEMMQAIETCFDIIESVPYFFSWISEIVDSKEGLVN